MPPAWEWTSVARYIGKHTIDESTFDLWAHHITGVELSVAVGEHDASRPHYFHRRSASEHRMYHLISWHTFAPNATWFNVPDICKNATEDVPSIEWLSTGAMGENSEKSECQAVAASTAARIVEQSNGMDAAALISSVFDKAGVEVSTNLWAQQQAGSSCSGGVATGDVFFDGVPASSVAIYLGDNKFAECPSYLGGRCSIVAQRDFTGGCRRFC
jgi:hypothetical protein